ncbi:MAG: leucine-rich repeat domain-containing protein [Pseudomonadota bacterium]
MSDRRDTLPPEIEQEIKENIDNGRRKFWLSNCGHLSCIPQSIVDAKPTLLSIKFCRIDDLSALSQMTELEDLRIEGLVNSDVSLAPLIGLKNLRSLDLDAQFRQKGYSVDLGTVFKLTQLEELRLWGVDIDDVTPLANLTQLKYLDLADTKISSFPIIQQLPNLEFLDLGFTAISDITPLLGATHLRNLGLDGTPLTELPDMASMTGLRVLRVSATKISDLTPVAGLRNLESLWIDHTLVADLTPVEDLPHLTQLEYNYTPAEERDPYWW